MKIFQFVALAVAVAATLAGCASTDTYPSASPPVLTSPDVKAPDRSNSDAAGAGSVPGYHSAPNVIVEPQPQPSSGVIVVPQQQPNGVIVVPQPR